ncbi:MAG: nitrite reductase (NO-forming) [Myxococcota bacterium]|jgi:nitrite reductase (NO-forming)
MGSSVLWRLDRGALGMMKVSGPDDLTIYSGKEVDSVYLADKAESSSAVADAAEPLASGSLSPEAQIAAGKHLFMGTCSTCHQPSGAGIDGIFPPLAGSDYLNADTERAIGVVINGLSGPVTVNSQDYNSVMPPMSQLNDDTVANILTYVYASWDNSGATVTSEMVASVRANTERPPGAAH